MRVVAALLVVVASCGNPDESPAVAADFALSSELAARVKQVQLAFVKPGASDCARLSATCLADQDAQLESLADGSTVHLFAFSPSSGAQTVDASVAAGTYNVVAEALDDAGSLVANACRLNVVLKPAQVTEATFTLVAFAGTCDARF